MNSSVAPEALTVLQKENLVFTLDSDIKYNKKQLSRHLLKSKDNTYKHRCNKLLKRKLKKYKLRQDGKDDPDVLYVSKILVSSLIIKSPTKSNVSIEEESVLHELENLRPKNYLFKMVKRKQAKKLKETLTESNSEANVQNEDVHSPVTTADQDKKQTNAFKLLMDSRNKSIGSNSPGKEKSEDHFNDEEIFEKRNIKAKRQLLLQKMADTKGAIKHKEIEEYQDKIIKKKLEKRAEKFKSMILKDTKSNNTKEDLKDKRLKEASDPNISNDKVEVVNNNNLKNQKAFKIIDIFNSIKDPVNISPERKPISEVDQDFLKKLSPSLKKKESMLCYFKKIDKDSSEVSPPSNTENNLIKVKLQIRNKKRGKKKRLSLKKGSEDTSDTKEQVEISKDNKEQTGECENVCTEGNNDIIDVEAVDPKENTVPKEIVEIVQENSSKRQKRKRNFQLTSVGNGCKNNTEILNNEGRPKRSVKRPVKYIDDAGLSSSDEELHIFTPKKKKHSEKDITKISNGVPLADEPVKQVTEKKVPKVVEPPKKPTKLAPIFTSKLDAAALEAKQKFLQSGVPDKLKKIIQQQKTNSVPDIRFPVIVHVQQNDDKHDTKTALSLTLLDNNEATDSLQLDDISYKKFLTLDTLLPSHNVDCNPKKSTQAQLQYIKQLHPKFPVYRTYRYLCGKKKGEFIDCNYVDKDNSIEIMTDMIDATNDSLDRLNWTDKYKAVSTNQIIGNFESIKEFRKWLITWTENELKSKPQSKPESDSSDYYQSETDSRDSVKTMNNLLILTGPTGCGKTASVYTVATELAMKVIEVNASSKRTGKIMLQDLQEATQSHKVNRGTSSTDNSQKSQEVVQVDLSKKIKKRGRPKRPTPTEKTKSIAKPEVQSGSPMSQEITRTDSSLILIDDADIVFEQDDGFSSAIMQLVQSSKRPVILTTSSLVCPHLQKFLQFGKILKLCPLSPRLLGPWLDIMCLADSGVCWPGVGAKFLDYFKGDIRKTINYLQFYTSLYVHGTTSEEETASQNIDLYKNNIEDEGSCMSWDEEVEGKMLKTVLNCNVNIETTDLWVNFVDKYSVKSHHYSAQLFNIWWSLPNLLSAKSNNNSNKKEDSNKNKVQNELETMANAIDAISYSDYLSHTDSEADVTSRPWYYPEGHSVSERENIDYYVKGHEVTEDICHAMVSSSIATAQDILGCDKKMDISFPGMTMQREREKVVTRHKNLTGYLNVSAALDRKALSLDYWPSCRTICRLEKTKTDTNMKRNNRFCHYLKSLSVLCKSDTFDNLCDSLCSNENTELNTANYNE